MLRHLSRWLQLLSSEAGKRIAMRSRTVYEYICKGPHFMMSGIFFQPQRIWIGRALKYWVANPRQFDFNVYEVCGL